MLWAIILFSCALSLDGFGVGLSYGMRKIKITLMSLVLISFSSALAVSLSMLLGKMTACFFAPSTANLVGAVILIVVGCWLFLQNLILNMLPVEKTYSIKVNTLGLVINILKEPQKADFDKSGVIDAKEAVFLGVALAMDALGAGFGAAMSGYSPLFTPLFVAGAKLIFISSGLYIGKQFRIKYLKGEMTLLPGGIIILLGFSKLLKI